MNENLIEQLPNSSLVQLQIIEDSKATFFKDTPRKDEELPKCVLNLVTSTLIVEGSLKLHARLCYEDKSLVDGIVKKFADGECFIEF